MPSCSLHGTFRVWPLCWLWSTDRDQTKDITGVHRAYLGQRIFPQCVQLTGEFNQHHSREEVARMTRHLDDMLALPDAQRQAYSFLCAGEGWLHGPLAIATVDPAVVRLDMSNYPADRYHGVTNMVDDMTGVVQRGIKARKKAQVSWHRQGYTRFVPSCV